MTHAICNEDFGLSINDKKIDTWYKDGRARPSEGPAKTVATYLNLNSTGITP